MQLYSEVLTTANCKIDYKLGKKRCYKATQGEDSPYPQQVGKYKMYSVGGLQVYSKACESCKCTFFSSILLEGTFQLSVLMEIYC